MSLFQVTQIAAASVPNPPAGTYTLFLDSGDGLWKKKDSLGNVTVVGAEINTASNVGIAGVGVFKQKTGVNFEFKKLNAGSSKVTLTDDTGNNEIDIDVSEANFTVFSGAGTKGLVPDPTSATGKVLSDSGAWITDAGEANTASNVGSGSGTEYGIFKQKTGVDFEFKKIKQGANITLTENGSDVTIASAGGATDLAATADGTSLTISSSTGTNATVPAVTTSAWGAMTDEDKTKLDGISAEAKKYYSQVTNNTTGGTVSAPYGSPVIVTSSSAFSLTVATTGSYLIYGTVNIGTNLNKEKDAIELMYGIDTGSGPAIGPAPYRQTMIAKKNKPSGIQGTWGNVALTAGHVVHLYISTLNDSCTWVDGSIFIAAWE